MNKARIALKLFFTNIYEKFPGLISDSAHARLLYWCMFGYIPDLDHPKTFNEKICSEKIKDYKLDYWVYTDKYKAREYVKKTVGEGYLNEVLGIYDSFDEIEFDKLPESFVMKGTHGSRYNILVPDKNRLDIVNAKKKFDKWLSENFYYKDREKNYKLIKPRIMIDRFLKPSNGEIEEFKLFCFDGVVRMISYNRGEGHDRKTNLYDEFWNPLNVKYGYTGFGGAEPPANKDELITVAENLSRPFNFVRVDLYNIDGKIYFSELTFHPGGGLVPFEPREYDLKLGSYFKVGQ